MGRGLPELVITRTPQRISFAGGGTDLADYYRTGYGAVLSTTIDKFVYVIVNKRFDDKVYISYTQKEIVDCEPRDKGKAYACRNLNTKSGIYKYTILVTDGKSAPIVIDPPVVNW